MPENCSITRLDAGAGDFEFLRVRDAADKLMLSINMDNREVGAKILRSAVAGPFPQRL